MKPDCIAKIRVIAAAFLLALLVCAGYLPQAAEAADQPFHFGFKKSKQGQPASIDQEGFKALLEKNDAFFIGDDSGKHLYLTFDNGYENGYTAQILDVLRDKQVPAAFFVTGQYIKQEPELLKRMVNEGHIIGNHSWSHPDMTTISDAQIREELQKVKQAVGDITGQKDMFFLRPPRGIFSDRTLSISREEHYYNVFWSVAYMDWLTDQQKGADYAFNKVTQQFHPGAIILLHSVSRDNAEAMGRIIDEARRQGYTFKSLNSLITPFG